MAMPTAAQNRLRNRALGVALLCAATVLAGGVTHSMATISDVAEGTIVPATAAQELFPDAPDGVDPVVTGPVSATLHKRQHQAGCAEAVWPNVPLACYPG